MLHQNSLLQVRLSHTEPPGESRLPEEWQREELLHLATFDRWGALGRALAAAFACAFAALSSFKAAAFRLCFALQYSWRAGWHRGENRSCRTTRNEGFSSLARAAASTKAPLVLPKPIGATFNVAGTFRCAMSSFTSFCTCSLKLLWTSTCCARCTHLYTSVHHAFRNTGN